MLIKGLTHDDSGALNMIEKYRGKISTGYAPGEGPNKKNHPVAAGFFRILKEITETKRVGNSDAQVVIKSWKLNDSIQKKLETTLKSKMPRRIELVSFYQTIDEMWESCLAMFSSSEGLMCKSHGEGTNARQLTFTPDGDREWVDRIFNGKKGCPYKQCPDYISKKCKPLGMLKCFPIIDLTPNPYRFETRSLNTIMGIESSLTKLWNLLNVAHAIKQKEANSLLKFDGFFGAKMYLIHKKIKSGGRDVFISELLPTQSFIDEVMEPIKRGLDMKSKQAKIAASNESMSLLEMAETALLESGINDGTDEESVPLSIEDQQHIAKEFGADADIHGPQEEASLDDVKKEVAETLLNEEE